MGAAGWIADDDADRFTLKVESLCRSVIAPEQCKDKQQGSFFHIASSVQSMNATINPFDISKSENIWGHSPKIFLSRWTTSGGCAITSLASDSSSSPATGETGQSLFFASDKSSGALKVLFKASRNIFTRSAGTPGGATMGRPNSPGAKTSVASRRPTSGVLYRSMSS